jgi:ornithine--oxo-acid transaminase
LAPTDPGEIKRLEALEAQALREIEQKVEQGKKPIGGIFIEPVHSEGVTFYRPEFMRALRALADRLRVPIFADEIMSGARTGKFFAYQHYEGFEPDFVTFGKAMQVAGVAQVRRFGDSIPRFHAGISDTTVKGDAVALLKGEAVLNRIADGNLLEHSREVGDHMLTKLRARDTPGEPPSHGFGSLLWTSPRNNSVRGMGYGGRLTPYITMTKEEADQLVW